MWVLMDPRDITDEIKRDTINKKRREHYLLNREAILVNKKKWYQKNKERLIEKYHSNKSKC
jgi:hypothetical protein